MTKWTFPNGDEVTVAVVGRVGRTNARLSGGAVIIQVVEPGIWFGMQMFVEPTK